MPASDSRYSSHGYHRTAQVCAAEADMTEAPVGEWVSPITSEFITSSSVGLRSTKVAADGYVYFLESRPSENGRSVLVRQ